MSSIDQTPGPPGGRWQNITNEAFPADARTIPDQRNPIPVLVRVVWERDGEEWLAGEATRWTCTHVFVAFGDARLATIGVCGSSQPTCGDASCRRRSHSLDQSQRQRVPRDEPSRQGRCRTRGRYL
jgi:hypothetical protein